MRRRDLVSLSSVVRRENGRRFGWQPPAIKSRANLPNAIAFGDFFDPQMLNALQNRGLAEKTLVIVSAKHSQPPIDRAKVVRLDNSVMIQGPVGSGSLIGRPRRRATRELKL